MTPCHCPKQRICRHSAKNDPMSQLAMVVALPSCGDMRSPSSSPDGRRGRRIVVSHRLPLRAVPNPDALYGYDFSVDTDALPFKYSRDLPGDVVFVGTLPAAAASSVPASEELAAHLLERFSCCPVFLDAELHEDFYHGFCKHYLWPLFHVPFLGNCWIDFQEKLYGAYIAGNTRFAERVLELLVNPDMDHVYIHGYHLLTLPSILRQKSPGTRTYFTFHSRFPSSATICSSHIGKDILCNLLSADFVAFVSFDDARHFLSSCTRLLNTSCQSTHGNVTIDYLKRAVVVSIIPNPTSRGKVNHPSQMLSLPVPETGAKARDISTKHVVMSKVYPADNWMRSFEQCLETIRTYYESILARSSEKLDSIPSKNVSHYISSRSKKPTLLVRKPSYLAQLVAACNSSASAEQSGTAMLRPSRTPLVRFILDSGASMHVVGDARLLRHLRRHLPQAAARFATLADGSRLPIVGVGTIQMNGFSIPNVYLVEGVTMNLVSVSRLTTEHNICVCFYRNQCQLMLLADGLARVVGEAALEDDGVYGLRFLRVPEVTAD